MRAPSPVRAGAARCSSPLELIDRIAALVPPPRIHRHRYFGLLAPYSPLRLRVQCTWRAEHGPPEMGKMFRMGATDILADILRLPAEERARLALELIHSLDGEPEADAAQAWDGEIQRRGAEVDSGTAETMTLDEYRVHIRKRRAARASR